MHENIFYVYGKMTRETFGLTSYHQIIFPCNKVGDNLQPIFPALNQNCIHLELCIHSLGFYISKTLPSNAANSSASFFNLSASNRSQCSTSPCSAQALISSIVPSHSRSLPSRQSSLKLFKQFYIFFFSEVRKFIEIDDFVGVIAVLNHGPFRYIVILHT